MKNILEEFIRLSELKGSIPTTAYNQYIISSGIGNNIHSKVNLLRKQKKEGLLEKRYLTADIEKVIARISDKYAIKGMDIENKCSFLRMHLINQLEKYDHGKNPNFKFWAIKVLTNKAIDLLRQYGREPSTFFYSPIKGSDGKIPLDVVAKKRIKKLERLDTTSIDLDIDINRALSNPREGVIVRLFSQGFSDKEIAEKEKISISACRKRKQRAFKKLRERNFLKA
jgi:RNA polymerase sigma factor (sigma-70 family)